MNKPLQVGSTIGQYRLDALLGEGGMGVVYRALDSNLNRQVAIKFLSPEVADAGARRRFQREAQTASSLNHPHILTVHDAGEWNEQHYVVTEFVDGGTLSNWAAAETRSWRQCVELLTGVADGLAASHEANILHRDVKPGNILVSKTGYAKLADFGLARLEGDPAGDETVTRTGVIVGTPAYMSPEQALGRKCDARSDIFSLGVVLYELLAGQRPFTGRSSPETLQQIIHNPPPSLSPSIPAPLRTVVEKALEKDPADRYQSAREMVVDLRRIARRADSVGHATGAVSAASPSRRRWWIPVAAVLALGAVIAIGLLFRSEPTGNEPLQRYQLAPPPGGRFEVGGIISLGGMALSPDGTTFAFAATANGVASLWVQPLTGVARPIGATEGVQRPFWSPDSKTIAYFGNGGLFRVDTAGGVPVLITKASTNLPCGGSWSESGWILFGCGGQLSAISVSNGETKLLFDQATAFPYALPGEAFLYFRGDRPGIYAASIANPEAGKLLVNTDSAGVYASDHLLWRSGTILLAQSFDPATLTLSGEPQPLLEPVGVAIGNDLLVTVSATGRMVYDVDTKDLQLMRFAQTAQRRLGPLGQAGSYQGPRFFDNGRRVIVQSNAAKDRGLWIFDERGLSKRLFADTVRVNPTLSPDGRSMTFSTPTESGWLLQRADITGDNLVSLKTPNTKDFQFPTDWSGEVLLFVMAEDLNKTDIWSLRVGPDGNPAPGAEPAPYLRTQTQENLARFAPGQGERWLAYESDESERIEIYVRSFPTKGEAIPVSKQGGRFPVWGPGGRQLFFIGLDDMLMVVDVKFGPDSVSTSEPRPVFPLPLSATQVATPYDTVDGEHFLVLVPVTPPTRPMQAINNWPALLKQR